MLKTFPFLYATRFWAMVIAAVSIYAQAKGWIGQPEMLLIASVTAGFTVVRTIDRATEQPIIAAAVTTGQVQASAVIDIPPLKSDTLSPTAKVQ